MASSTRHGAPSLPTENTSNGNPDNDDEADFFESLRKQQSEIDENQQEKPRVKIIDSTLVLQTERDNRSDIPDLIPNISPTSVSTTTSEQEYTEKDIPIYIKTKTSKEGAETVSSTARRKKKRFVFGLSFAVLSVVSATVWLVCDRIATSKGHQQYLGRFQYMKPKHKPLGVIQHNQEVAQMEREKKIPKNNHLKENPDESNCQQISKNQQQQKQEDKAVIHYSQYLLQQIKKEVTRKKANVFVGQQENMEIHDHEDNEDEEETDNDEGCKDERPEQFGEQNIVIETHETDRCEALELHIQWLIQTEEFRKPGYHVENEKPEEGQQEISPEQPKMVSTSTIGTKEVKIPGEDKYENPNAQTENITGQDSFPSYTEESIPQDLFEEELVQSNAVFQSIRTKCRFIINRATKELVEIKFQQYVVGAGEQLASASKDAILSIMHLAEDISQHTRQVPKQLVMTTGLFLEQFVAATKDMSFQVIDQVKHIAYQVAKKIATTTSLLTKQFLSAAKRATLRMMHQAEHISQQVNMAMEQLALANTEIQKSNTSMVGARESLAHIGNAFGMKSARIMSRKLEVASMTSFAPTNSESKAKYQEMVYVWDSFAYVGNVLAAKGSRIMSRKLEVTSMKSFLPTNTGSQARTQTTSGARESFAHVGNALQTKAARIMSRPLKVRSILQGIPHN